MSENLERKKNVTVKGDVFELDIAKLTVESLLLIESEKQRLSKSEYSNIATTYFPDSQNAASLIDMIAIFRVLLPDIEKSIASDLYEKLTIIDARDLLKVYLKDVAPWYRLWMKEFNTPFESDEKDDVENDEK